MQAAKPIKVGYIVKRYPRYSETFIVNEILAHERAGLAVEIFALRPPTDTHFQDVIAQVRAPVHYLLPPARPAELWQSLEAASHALPDLWASLVRGRGEDVRLVGQGVAVAHLAHRHGLTHLHAHFATSATTVARLASAFSGLPYTFTAHAKDIFHESVRPADLRQKLQEAAAAITVSDYNQAYLKARYGVAAARVTRIYNGLSLPAFPYQAPAQRRPRIVSVGRLVEKKGFPDLVDACAVLAERGVAFDCHLIGSGELEGVLRNQIERRGLQEIVQMVGPRPQQDVKDRIRDAAVFAAPCVVGQDGNRDGLPTVLLEAMALGTPCIATDVTGIPEVLFDGDTGLMVPQHKPARLADALEQLLTDAALRTRLAAQARRLIESQFDVDHNAALLRRHFAAADGQRPAAPARLVEAAA